MKYPAIYNFATLLYCLLGLAQSATAQLCAGSWALQRPATSQCVTGQWIGWQNDNDPMGCPISPSYFGTQINTFTFSSPVDYFIVDFRGTDGIQPGCARIEVRVNNTFYPLNSSNLVEIPPGSTCTSGLFSNIELTNDGYITISSTGGPGRIGVGRIIIDHLNTTSFTISTNDGFGTVFSNPFNCSDIVPLTLESFTGVVSQSCKANLEWRTGIELNVDRIDVERKGTDLTFQKIATVTPHGSGSEYFVEVDHANDAFYRLKIIDLDETYQYSETIFIKARCNEALYQIHPNPSSGIVTIPTLRQGNLVRILDLQGRVLSDFRNFQEHNRLDISGLAPSIYILQIIRQGKIVSNLKLVKK